VTSEARVIRRARFQTAGRVLLWTVVVIVGVRGVVSIFKSSDHATVSAQSASVTQTTATSPVTDGAKTEAVLFVQQWLTVHGNEKPQDWVNNLQPYVTPTFAADMQKNLPVTWQAPTPTPKGKQQPAPKSVPTPNLSVVQANVWASHWVKPDNEALVTVRTQTNDNTLWYLSVPVVKFRDTWRVSSAPALLPQPQTPSPDANSNSSVSATVFSPQETQEVQAALDPFFRAWLTGDSNTADRYMVNPAPATNEMQSIGGQVKNVSFTPVSSDPLVVNAIVSVATHNMTMDFSYLVTLAQQHGQYFIQSIENNN
jgi:Conjugative transposon protein TcpC